MAPHGVVVGRQPIFDAVEAVVGYELLFRSSPDATFADGQCLSSDEMTIEATTAALHIGLDRITGGKTVFCNADRGIFTGETPILLPADRTVIELLESVEVDAEILAGCRALVDAGYGLALDDFVWFDGVEELLEMTDIVKLDVLALGEQHALALAESLKPFDVRLLAEKVETYPEFVRYRDSGFELFQGFALAHPTVMTGTALTAPAVAVLELAAVVLDEGVDYETVEDILRRDPALALQVLQIATIGVPGELRRPVRTLRDGLVLLGTRRLRAWITLLLFVAQPDTETDQIVTVLQRARMCELLAEARGPQDAAFAFTAGMISALDRLLGIPPEALADRLPLDRHLIDTAFHGAGPIGAIITQAISYETGTAVSDRQLEDAAVAALSWASGIVGILTRV